MRSRLPIRYTKGQLALQKIIEKEIGLQTILEYPVGDYSLDIFLPELGDRAVEFDGPLHGKRRDAKRDQIILEQSGIKIMRVKDLKDPDLLESLREFLK
jgi:very-short-patch-repair endonuclease